MKIFKLDHLGYLKNDLTTKDLPNKWINLIETVKQTYIEILKNNVYTIYLRGSVAFGTPLDNYSDIDTFCLTKKTISNKEQNQLKIASLKINTENNFISNCELEYVCVNDVLQNKSYEFYNFLIKVESICIYGTNIQNIIPSYKPKLYNFSLIHSLKKRTLFFSENYHKEDKKALLIWITKSIIRSAYDLILENTKEHTKDIGVITNHLISYFPKDKTTFIKLQKINYNPTYYFDNSYPFIIKSSNFIQDKNKNITQIIETSKSTRYYDKKN